MAIKWLDMHQELTDVHEGLKKVQQDPTPSAIREQRKLVLDRMAKMWRKLADFADTLDSDEFDKQLFPLMRNLLVESQNRWHEFIMSMPNQGTIN